MRKLRWFILALSRVLRVLCVVCLPAALVAGTPVHGADVQVIGVFGSKATLIINGGRPRTLSAGESTPEKIRLISVSADSAVIEADGKRQTLHMGQTGQRIGGGASGGTQRVTLTADAKGHFVTTATINGVSMQFLVDTGATAVVINSNHAKSAGISYAGGEQHKVQTANGLTTARKIKLDTVRIGDITLTNVDAMVLENQQLGSVGLLGMSFLNRTEMRRDGDSMTLTRRY